MDYTITKTQRDALNFLKSSGGTGVFTNSGHLLCAGRIAGVYPFGEDQEEYIPYSNRTWRKLALYGMVNVIGKRVTVTAAGHCLPR